MRRHGQAARMLSGEVERFLTLDMPAAQAKRDAIESFVSSMRRRARDQGTAHGAAWHSQQMADDNGESPNRTQRELMGACWTEARRLGLSEYEICGIEVKAHMETREAIGIGFTNNPWRTAARNFRRIMHEVLTNDEEREYAYKCGREHYDDWKRAYDRS